MEATPRDGRLITVVTASNAQLILLRLRKPMTLRLLAPILAFV
jgi:hypothetical protein